jgi:hypothetical protein
MALSPVRWGSWPGAIGGRRSLRLADGEAGSPVQLAFKESGRVRRARLAGSGGVSVGRSPLTGRAVTLSRFVDLKLRR